MLVNVLVGLLVASSATVAEMMIKTGKRAAVAANIDGLILNHVLSLGHMESALYQSAMTSYSAQNFSDSGFPEWVRERMSEIASHEAEQVTFLSDGLKASNMKAVEPCTYTFPHTDPQSFLTTAQILKGIGVSAYLGILSKITNADVLTVAASILAVESTQRAWIRSGAQHEDGIGGAFDTALDFDQVFTLLAHYTVSCPPSSPNLGFKRFPDLTLTAAAPIVEGQLISLVYENAIEARGMYAVFYSGLNQIPVPYDSITGTVNIPKGLVGQNYVVIAKIASNTTAASENIVAGPVVIEIFNQAHTYAK